MCLAIPEGHFVFDLEIFLRFCFGENFRGKIGNGRLPHMLKSHWDMIG